MDKFTKQDLYDDVRQVLLAFADCLGRVFTQNIGFALLGIDKAHSASVDFTDLTPADIDLDMYRLTDALSYLYDYSFEAKRPLHFMYADDCEDTVLFFNGLYEFALMEESSFSDYRLDRISYTLRLANARFALDDGDGTTSTASADDVFGSPTQFGVITLQDVALLAGMDEKSVRNAANRNREDRLKTFNHGQGTYVLVADAREWLSGRRGFKPTVYYDAHLDRDLTKVGFYSPSDLGNYLKGKREKRGMSVATVVQAMELPSPMEHELQDVENGEFYFNPDFYARLARVYELDVKAFVLAGLTLCQRLERNRIEKELEHESASPAATK